MKIAYVILAYKLPEQLVRLVKKLNSEGVHFFIHVDSHADNKTYQLMNDPLKNLSNVHFIGRIQSKWGQLGCVQATLRGIKEVYTQNIEFDYLINLSGQDYPLISNQSIHNILQENKGMSFIRHNPIPYPSHGHIDDFINYWHFYWRDYHFVWPREDMFFRPALNRVWNILAKRITIRRKLPLNQKPYYGSTYWCLTSDCVEYIYDFINGNKSYENFFKYVQYPTEFFFQTILLNSAFKERIINENLRYIDFSAKKANPKVLGKEDFDKFMNSGSLFARKFDITYDSEVLDMIDERISVLP